MPHGVHESTRFQPASGSRWGRIDARAAFVETLHPMRLKLIACNVFMREACHCIARSPHLIDPEFLELGEHVHPDILRGKLQVRLDAAGAMEKSYDAVLLLYGLCGNSSVGLRAVGVPLVLPRAHDCCTVLLGSRAQFREHFGDNPSMPFSSAGYIERGDYFLRTDEGGSRMHFGDGYAALVEQYGEENAKYVWETMHPEHPEFGNRAVFIDLPETAHLGYRQQFEAKVRAEGKECVRLAGSLRIIENLLFGNWDPAEFLTVPPGQAIAGVYDWTEIVRSAPSPTP